MNLFKDLPTPDIIDTRTFEDMFAEVLQFYLDANPGFDNPVEGDPIYAAIEAGAYSKLGDAKDSNEKYRQTTLALATGTNLDIIAMNLGVTRNIKVPAVLDGQGNIETPAVLETDHALRNRAWLQWAGLGAGTALWYLRHALAADPQVKDAKAVIPDKNNPGNVKLWIQSEAENGGVAPQSLLDTVIAYIDDSRRILNDNLMIASIATVTWNLTATVEFEQGENPTERLAELETMLTEWAKTQEVIGQNIRLSHIYRQLVSEFVAGIMITAPASDIAITDGQVPVLGTVTLTTS